MLQIRNLNVSSKDRKDILKNFNLNIKKGELHILMGPNGAGKTTLAQSLMGSPKYIFQINNSEIIINKNKLINKNTEERAKNGIFISFQEPVAIPGVSFLSFLRASYKAIYPQDKTSLSEFKKKVKVALKKVGLSEDFMLRAINEGFSGGEKKKGEILQLLILRPKFAVLDEIDSGVDTDSLKKITKCIKEIIKDNKTGVLLITHYQKIIYHLKPDYVHVLIDGTIKKSDGVKLVKLIEQKGYAAV